jgi:hypothetical protein
VVREAFEIFQENGHSQFGRELSHCCVNGSRGFDLSAAVLLDPSLRHGLKLSTLFGSHRFCLLLSKPKGIEGDEAPAPALFIEARIDNQPVEPGSESGVMTELPDALEELEEDLLGDVAGHRSISGEMKCD